MDVRRQPRAVDGVHARCIDFIRRMDERMSATSVRTAHGVVYVSESLSRVWDRNFLVVDRGAQVGAASLVLEADSVQGPAGLGHRKIKVDDALGERLAPEFAALGWTVHEFLVMVHRRDVHLPDTSATREVDAEELAPHWSQGIRKQYDEPTAGQLLRAQLERQGAVAVRYFAAVTEQDEVAAYCELFSDAGIGQIESVLALEEFRGRGFGKSVVARALEASHRAGHDLTFLVADASDWPKELYRKLGFDEVGRMWDFIREPVRPLAVSGGADKPRLLF